MKRLILVAALPASGKNYVCEKLLAALGDACYLDKDDLVPLVSRGFSIAGEEPNMDASFYAEHLRGAEYETLFSLAFSALRFSCTVLVNAPLSSEVRNIDFMKQIKARAAALGAHLFLVWVQVSEETRYERMKQRNAPRDAKKLLNFAEYAKKTNAAPPLELAECAAVDGLILFDNEDAAAAERSTAEALLVLLGG